MKQWALFILSVLLLLLLVSCGGSVDTEKPPDIAYGQDVCDRCSMIINEEKYAAAYWIEEGEARRFDDIGGMLAYTGDTSEDVVSFWVHDFSSGEWIRAEGAHYVLNSDLMTPMGFGIAAFEDEEQAQAMAHGLEGVTILSFMELLAMDITMPEDLHEAAHGHEDS